MLFRSIDINIPNNVTQPTEDDPSPHYISFTNHVASRKIVGVILAHNGAGKSSAITHFETELPTLKICNMRAVYKRHSTWKACKEALGRADMSEADHYHRLAVLDSRDEILGSIILTHTFSEAKMVCSMLGERMDHVPIAAVVLPDALLLPRLDAMSKMRSILARPCRDDVLTSCFMRSLRVHLSVESAIVMMYHAICTGDVSTWLCCTPRAHGRITLNSWRALLSEPFEDEETDVVTWYKNYCTECTDGDAVILDTRIKPSRRPFLHYPPCYGWDVGRTFSGRKTRTRRPGSLDV